MNSRIVYVILPTAVTLDLSHAALPALPISPKNESLYERLMY